jgi:hypothetical protein
MQWWVTTGDRKPIGPVSTELLLQGIAAGEVPKDAFVCEVGGTSWNMIGSIPEFRDAFARHPTRQNFEPATTLGVFDESTASPSVPPPLQSFGDETERTIVEPPEFLQSEPPLEYIDDDEDDLATTVRPSRPRR